MPVRAANIKNVHQQRVLELELEPGSPRTLTYRPAWISTQYGSTKQSLQPGKPQDAAGSPTRVANNDLVMMIVFRIRLRFPKSFSRSSSVSVSVSGLEDEACSSSPWTVVVVIVGCCVCTYIQPAQYIGRTLAVSSPGSVVRVKVNRSIKVNSPLTDPH